MSRWRLSSSTWPTSTGPGEEPLGKCLLVGSGDDLPCTTVVGIAENARRQELVEDETAQYYVPLRQGIVSDPPMAIFVRTAPDRVGELLPTVRREIHAAGLSGAIRFVDVRPLDDFIAPQQSSWRLGATMFTVFGLLALVIVAVGLYGALCFNVAQRSHEIGVRSALGATRSGVVRTVVTQAVRVATADARPAERGASLRKPPLRPSQQSNRTLTPHPASEVP